MRFLILIALVGCGSNKSDGRKHKTDELPNTKTADTGESVALDTALDAEPEPLPCGTLIEAKSIGGPSFDTNPLLAEAPDASLYMLADFQDRISFDVGGPNETELVATGTSAVMLVRYSSAGDFEWARQIGGPTHTSPTGVVVTGDGGIVIIGSFDDSIVVSEGQPDAVGHTSLGERDGWLARFNPAGDVVWSKTLGGVEDDFIGGLALLDDSSLVISGSHSGTATLGAGDANETVLSVPLGSENSAFVARFSTDDGTLSWAQPIGGTTYSYADAVAVHGGQVSVVGGCSGLGVATFGAGQLNESDLDPDGSALYVAHYDGDGELVWLTSVDGASSGTLAAADDGSLLVSGSVQNGSATFGAGLPTQTVLSTNASEDLFVARYDTSGDLLWAVQSESPPFTNTSSRALAVHPDGGTVIVGDYNGAARFGVGEATEVTLTLLGDYDVFAARFADDGTFMCVQQIAGTQMDVGMDVLRLGDGNWHVSGVYLRNTTVAAGTPEEVELDGAGILDIFLATFAF